MLVPFLYNFKFKVSEIKIYLIKIGFISFFFIQILFKFKNSGNKKLFYYYYFLISVLK